MAKKIISKGSGSSSYNSNKRNTSSRGEPTLNNVDGQNLNTHLRTHCGHKHHHHGVSENSKRPFKSETNLFSSTVQTCLTPSGEGRVNLERNQHGTIINASNGFIPIPHQHRLSDKGDRSQTPQADGGSEVTVFKTKVLYHSRSDFRPIGQIEGSEMATEGNERAANV